MLTDSFCRKHLNDEYADLARRMAAALSRKRHSPLASGQPSTCACGILHAFGQINLLSDPATKPHMTMASICAPSGSVKARSAPKPLPFAKPSMPIASTRPGRSTASPTKIPSSGCCTSTV
ncbi:DUF6398 domain-containing protein [Mesorhizobium sp. M0771]|uniref:DUF6398 domain-containing protein n=1 Tax=Mesorhizobium sp. M0771 TaxID=2956997 RepID=UPI003337C746